MSKLTLQQIAEATLGNSGLFTSTSLNAWAQAQETRGEMVRLFRDYQDGQHRISLSPEMKAMLRMVDGGVLNQFNLNYMDVIIQTMVDRLNVTGIEALAPTMAASKAPKNRTIPPVGAPRRALSEQNSDLYPDTMETEAAESDEDPAQEWVETLLDDNRFDGMQGDVAEAAVRDGDTYLLEYWDNDDGCVKFSHEPAWDGAAGMIVYYATRQQKRPSVALKIWQVGIDSSDDDTTDLTQSITYVNVYWPNRVEHWGARSGALRPLTADVLKAPQVAPALNGTKPVAPPSMVFIPAGATMPMLTAGSNQAAVRSTLVEAVAEPMDDDEDTEQDETLPQPVEPWVMRDGKPIGMPVIAFSNRATSGLNYGRSELKNAIPIQDSINRTLISAIMASELTAFGIRYAFGFEPPAGMTPGMWIKAGHTKSDNDPTIVPPSNADEAAGLSAVRVGQLDPSPLAPYLDELRYLSGELGKITRTPAPEFMGGDAASGEALKQRETPLIGKVRRAQIKLGNAWEDALSLAHRIQQAFADGITQPQPPPIKRFNTQWDDPEIRNDSDTIKNAALIADRIGDRQFLKIVGKVYDWDDATIEQILAQRNTDNARRIASIGGSLPGFGNFSGMNPPVPSQSALGAN